MSAFPPLPEAALPGTLPAANQQRHTFQSLSTNDYTKRITWNPNAVQMIARHASKYQYSHHDLPSVFEAEDLLYHLGLRTRDAGFYSAAAEKTIAKLKRDIVHGAAGGAVYEVKYIPEGSKKAVWECGWKQGSECFWDQGLAAMPDGEVILRVKRTDADRAEGDYKPDTEKALVGALVTRFEERLENEEDVVTSAPATPAPILRRSARQATPPANQTHNTGITTQDGASGTQPVTPASLSRTVRIINRTGTPSAAITGNQATPSSNPANHPASTQLQVQETVERLEAEEASRHARMVKKLEMLKKRITVNGTPAGTPAPTNTGRQVTPAAPTGHQRTVPFKANPTPSPTPAPEEEAAVQYVQSGRGRSSQVYATVEDGDEFAEEDEQFDWGADGEEDEIVFEDGYDGDGDEFCSEVEASVPDNLVFTSKKIINKPSAPAAAGGANMPNPFQQGRQPKYQQIGRTPAAQPGQGAQRTNLANHNANIKSSAGDAGPGGMPRAQYANNGNRATNMPLSAAIAGANNSAGYPSLLPNTNQAQQQPRQQQRKVTIARPNHNTTAVRDDASVSSGPILPESPAPRKVTVRRPQQQTQVQPCLTGGTGPNGRPLRSSTAAARGAGAGAGAGKSYQGTFANVGQGVGWDFK